MELPLSKISGNIPWTLTRGHTICRLTHQLFLLGLEPLQGSLLALDLGLQIAQTGFGRMLFETFAGFSDATRKTEQLRLGTFFDQVLVELLATHFWLMVATVGALVHLEGAALLLQVGQKAIVGIGFELTLFNFIGFNLVRNFLLFESVFFRF